MRCAPFAHAGAAVHYTASFNPKPGAAVCQNPIQIVPKTYVSKNKRQCGTNESFVQCGKLVWFGAHSGPRDYFLKPWPSEHAPPDRYNDDTFRRVARGRREHLCTKNDAAEEGNGLRKHRIINNYIKRAALEIYANPRRSLYGNRHGGVGK